MKTQILFDKSMLVNASLTSLRFAEIFCSTRLVVKGKSGKEAPELSRKEILENNKASKFAVSVVKDGTSRPLTREII